MYRFFFFFQSHEMSSSVKCFLNFWRDRSNSQRSIKGGLFGWDLLLQALCVGGTSCLIKFFSFDLGIFFTFAWSFTSDSEYDRCVLEPSFSTFFYKMWCVLNYNAVLTCNLRINKNNFFTDEWPKKYQQRKNKNTSTFC